MTAYLACNAPECDSMKKTEDHLRNARCYISKMTPFVRTPLQRLRNVMVVNNFAIRDLLHGRTSVEVVRDVIRAAKAFDGWAAQRGVADPLDVLRDELFCNEEHNNQR